MYEVSIYIATRGGVCAKHGRYGYVIEYITPDGKARHADGYGGEENTTGQRMTLLALCEALKRMTRRSHITLYIPDPFIRGAVGMQRFRSRKQGSRPPKNAELWEKAHRYMDSHEITVIQGASMHRYKEILRERMI